MNITRYRGRLEGYRNKLAKMTPGQRKSWYARWITNRIVRMSGNIKAIEAAVGRHSRPVGNYQFNPDELPKL